MMRTECFTQQSVLATGFFGGLLFIFVTASSVFAPSEKPLPTSIGTCYVVNPLFANEIKDEIKKIRNEIQTQRQEHKYIAYLSTPVSPHSGVNLAVNKEIARYLKGKLEKSFHNELWVLNPAEKQLEDIGSDKARGGEYMYMWTEVLAGEEGLGQDFDMWVMTGPSDVRAYFRESEPNIDTDILGALDDWIGRRSRIDSGFRQWIASNPEQSRAFRNYYGMKASVVFSAGSHDEWNVFEEINRRRREKLGMDQQIPVYFDGRGLSAAEMETKVSEGNEKKCP